MASSTSILSSALNLFDAQLELFATSPDYQSSMILSFGESHDYTAFEPIFAGGGRTGVLSLLEIVPLASLNGAYGAFSRDTNKIYLASEYINSATPTAIADILLEEYGHYIDAQLNIVETIGDEGEIFADLVQGKTINPGAFMEDDTKIININGNWITVEQTNVNFFNPTPYFSFNDSPFKSIQDKNQFSYFYLEDFEDVVLNILGVVASSMSITSLSTTTFPNSTQTDSVDGDDGIIDGFGRNGHRLFDRGNGTIGGIRFIFNRNTLGAFLTYVGIVWTDFIVIPLLT